MSTFVLQRLAQALVLLVIVSIIGFAILHMAPGGPLSQFAADGNMTQADLDRLADQLGLNRSLPVQYFEWFYRMLQGDWGVSYRDKQPVLNVIFSHLGATFELMFASTFLAIIIGIWVGTIGAIRRYSFFDSFTTISTMVALSIPTFWFGLVIIYVFSVDLGWLPAGNRYTIGDGSFLNRLHHLVGPTIVLALVSTAIWSRYMRSSMLDVINQDYIRTARAKGVSERNILLHHAMRNALLPMITIAGIQIPSLLSGALVTETVFAWPGMGRLFLDSISYRDYPVVMGILMFSAALVILGSLLADVFYSIADPRISR